jgi:hypothetical protein
MDYSYLKTITTKNSLDYVQSLAKEYKLGGLALDENYRIKEYETLHNTSYTVFFKSNNPREQIFVFATKTPRNPKSLYSITISSIGSPFYDHSNNDDSDAAKIVDEIRTLVDGRESALFRNFFEKAYMVLMKNEKKDDRNKKISILESFWKKPINVVDFCGAHNMLKNTDVGMEFNDILTEIIKYNRNQRNALDDNRDLIKIQAKILFFIRKANRTNIFQKAAHAMKMEANNILVRSNFRNLQDATVVNPIKYGNCRGFQKYVEKNR